MSAFQQFTAEIKNSLIRGHIAVQMSEAPVEHKPICRLDASVVNKIAAGEIIIAPSNALKEMLENSIDANSTLIDIVVKEGGLKLLQITDDGCGVSHSDLPLLCERFATSKLSKFEDLNSIATYGFRGEALASISHIAHLSVVTKTEKDECAWKCYYSDGKLASPTPNESSEPKPTAGKKGTQISVEDLFYNVPSRLRALKGGNDEYNKIADVVGRYSIHTLNVGFTCKKFGNGFSDINVRSSMSRKDRIRQVFGSSVANDLIEISIEGNEDFGLMSCEGQITNSNYNNKKVIAPVFFINNRLVACDPLRRAINQVYSIFLPKGFKPFIYLSLMINPANLDVNVHPTKREVRFLHEDEIIEHIVLQVQTKLSSLDSSRTFLTQKVTINNKRLREEEEEGMATSDLTQMYNEPKFSTRSTAFTKRVVSGMPDLNKFKKTTENKLVRTDFAQSKLNSFLTSNGKLQSSIADNSKEYKAKDTSVNEDRDEEADESVLLNDTEKDQEGLGNEEESELDIVVESGDREYVSVQLKSIKSLCEDIESRVNKNLTDIFSKHTYVGVIDYNRRLLCFQYDVKLFLIDYASLCNEMFYQVGLSDFSNFGLITFDNNISIREQLEKVYDNESFIKNYKGKIPEIDDIIDKLVNMSEMFEEYFSMIIEPIEDTDIKDANLKSLPMLVKGYIPPLIKLPLFLFKIGSRVDFNDEKACLGGILRQLALFYIPEAIAENHDEDQLENEKAERRRQEISKTLEDVISPLVKRRFLATNTLVRDVIEIADLPGLYRVFERC